MNKLTYTQSPKDNSWDIGFDSDLKRANTVPIASVLKAYGIRFDPYARSIICPFGKRHKDGRDRSPSFTIFTNTNSFWCFGCKTGNTPVDFVVNMDNISLSKAAQKILSILAYQVNLEDFDNVQVDFSARLDALMDFSNYIRNIMSSNIDQETQQMLDEACLTFDALNKKYKKNMTNDILISIIDRLKKKVDAHITCQM